MILKRPKSKPGQFWFPNFIFKKGYWPFLRDGSILVYSAICRFAGDDSTWLTSISFLAQQIGQTPRSVSRHLEKLERLGLISITRRDGEANLYTLLDPFSSTGNQVAGNGPAHPKK